MPITAMEFTVPWRALYLNENYVVWVIGQVVETWHSMACLNVVTNLNPFFFNILSKARPNMGHKRAYLVSYFLLTTS